MLRINNVAKHFGTRVLFENASLATIPGERLALFGRNGSGKSTLLKMIVEEEHPDSGDVVVPRGYRVGYLKQHLSFAHRSVLEEVCATPAGEPVVEQYQAEIVLDGLGFTPAMMAAGPETLSGGFQIRINLAKLLLSAPNLMLLDEPTNYLDIISMRWLERFLKEWRSEIIVISHDRAFCDAVSTHSALIYRNGIRKIQGGSEKLFEQIAEEEEVYEQTRLNRDKTRKDMEAFINRFRSKASKASVVQSRVKALAKLSALEELSSEAALEFSFTTAAFPGRFPIEVSNLSFSYSVEEQAIIKELSFAVKKDDRIAIIGKNGRGKSTLLRLLADEIAPNNSAITRSPNAHIGFFAQTNINRLHADWTIEKEIADANPDLGRTQIRSICGAMMFDGHDGEKAIKVLSGGERSRVMLGRILAKPNNVLLLDEPTNHLDLESVLALTDALERFDGSVLIVTHNEEILRRVAKRLIVFQGPAPFVFEGDYDHFLRTVGWDEERESGKASAGRVVLPAGAAARDRKREKAQLIQERSQVINPLRKQVQGVESRITALEKEVQSIQQKLAEASERGAGTEIVSLAKNLEKNTKELEASMQEWESVSEQLAKSEGEYAQRLSEFE